MNKEEYLQLVNKKSKPSKVAEHAFLSFIIGGLLASCYELITVLLQSIFNLDAELSVAITMLIYITVAVVLTGFGSFDKLVSKYTFGLIIPITGFAHSVMSAILDYKRDGLITGVGSNAFKLAGSVILYGIISAFFFTILKVIIYG